MLRDWLQRLNMPMLFDNYSSRSNRSVFLADTLCRDGSPVQGLCAEALYSIVGSDKAQMNKVRRAFAAFRPSYSRSPEI